MVPITTSGNPFVVIDASMDSLKTGQELLRDEKVKQQLSAAYFAGQVSSPNFVQGHW